MDTEQIGSLIEKCGDESRKLHSKALRHKWISNLGNFIIIIGSAVSGIIISAYREQESAAIILSFSIAAIKSLMVFYSPEKRAMMTEKISIEFSRLARKLRSLDTNEPDQRSIKSTIDKIYRKLEELSLKQLGLDILKINDENSSAQEKSECHHHNDSAYFDVV